ncbi:hypothetical protein [Bdellovibrio svalbardensis]|uniref:Porin n=1 Tax=Bdellovibrio svalbardensis TaxID=2972972 RepID=A0ABT6DP04_9BACT|nr:hypothetical protein [Bdellovibrio svalbardensis]MDG0818222.1 hypothetical protein [Bdellovibrio svalbardensis]
MSSHDLTLCIVCLLTFSHTPLAQAQSEWGREGGAYSSATFGNGSAYGPSITGENSMQWKTFEVRFGKEWERSQDGAELRFDAFHFNEGHPENNHRDGFGFQAVARKDINSIVSAEAGVGPYFSMNTTIIDSVEYDDPRLGAMVTMAILANMDRLSPGLHMRFAVNHVTMPGAASSNAFLVGIGKDFDPVYSRGRADSYADSTWYGVMVGDSKTNHGGTAAAVGTAIEVKKYFEPQWATSISAIVEGDDKSRVDRNGVAVQGWFVQPLNDKWSASAGVGPYVAVNRRDSGEPELDGLITIQVERSIGKNWKIYANFNRIASFKKNNDRDMGRIGISRQFNLR